MQRIQIGLEYEGVFLRHNGDPIRSATLFPGKTIIFKDSYDACAEVRTHPFVLREADTESSMIQWLGASLLIGIDQANQAAADAGGSIAWDEILIPDDVHWDIMRNVSFEKKLVQCALDDSEIEAKVSNAYQSDRYRGGGLHINVSGIPDERIPIVAKLFAKSIPTPYRDQPHRSQYRKPGLWKRSTYPDGCKGFEYRSPGFGFNPLGIIHFYHIMQATFRILDRERKNFSQ